MPSYSPQPASFGVDVSISPSDRYNIVGRIASGGMAEIYLARMSSKAGVQREVVLKRLLPELQSDHEFVQMFHDEARIASQLSHPNVVQIYELGELDGSLFIAMELLRGINLRDLLARIHASGDELPKELALRICCGCLEALDYAHAFKDEKGEKMNVVHRDVSPQNILVTFDGTVKLVDFGVAKAEGRLHQTRAGLVKGKFAYMSPEQITGGKLDGRSDIFALAEVFYELMLRRHPFYAATDMDVLRAILDSEPPNPCELDPSFSPELGAIFMKAMAKAPNDRYATAGEMHEAVEQYLARAQTPATTIRLGRFVREAFADRVRLEEKARQKGDDELLVEAMTAGHAEKINFTESGMRKAVVAPASKSSSATRSKDPDERATGDLPASKKSSTSTEPEGEGRSKLRSEVQDLFGEGGDANRPAVQPADHERHEDATEMPTMLGDFTPEQLAEVRRAAESVRVRDFDRGGGQPPGAGQRPGDVAVVEAKVRTGPTVTRSVPPPADPASSGQVTARSETLVPQETGATKKTFSDRIGLLFFIAGLMALIGAVIYASQVLLAPSAAVMSLSIASNPPGASIVLDGTDIGALTPQTLPTVASDKAHTIELRLKGYQPYEQRLDPLPHAKKHEISATLKPEP